MPVDSSRPQALGENRVQFSFRLRDEVSLPSKLFELQLHFVALAGVLEGSRLGSQLAMFREGWQAERVRAGPTS